MNRLPVFEESEPVFNGVELIRESVVSSLIRILLPSEPLRLARQPIHETSDFIERKRSVHANRHCARKLGDTRLEHGRYIRERFVPIKLTLLGPLGEKMALDDELLGITAGGS